MTTQITARLSGAFLAAWIIFPLLLSGQSFDTTPPTLVGFSFTPTSENVASGPQTVTVTIHATDDLSGFFSGKAYINVGFISPSGNQSQFADSNVMVLPGSTSLDANYVESITIPQFSESGNWTASVSMSDAVGNIANLNASDLASMFFPSILPVTSVPDTTPPTLAGLTINPSSIDVSNGPQSVTLAMNLTDSQSGVAFPCQNTPCHATLYFVGPTVDQLLSVFPFDVNLTSGTINQGVWTATVTFPQHAAAGNWNLVQLGISDTVGNFGYLKGQQIQNLGFPAVVQISSTPTDSVPPVLTGLTISPLVVNTSSGAQPITLSLALTDNLSGVDFTAGSLALTPDSGFNPVFGTLGQEAYGFPYFPVFDSTGRLLNSPNFNISVIVFTSPSGQQNLVINLYHNSFSLNSGTPQNGQWQVTTSLPQFSEGGTWTLQYLTVQDSALNTRFLNQAALQALNLPTSFVVFKPTLQPDGSVGASGGTVSDTVFGTRASLTFPPGEVNSSTTVSIDVLSSPLSVPTPSGFSVNPATLFTNIQLVPEPSFPLPAPGLTLTLPLVNPLAAGTVLNLYRLDPSTGGPIPALNIAGANIRGTVDPAGLSATFKGISRLSTAVAYLPLPGTLVGDVNGDGKIDCQDVALIKAAFGAKSGQPAFNTNADLNNDGVINVLDLALIARLLPPGTSCP